MNEWEMILRNVYVLALSLDNNLRILRNLDKARYHSLIDNGCLMGRESILSSLERLKDDLEKEMG